MDINGIKDERLQRLMKSATNAGGILEADMLDALKRADSEADFAFAWYWKLRNEHNRIAGFFNELAVKLGKKTTALGVY